MSDPAAGESEGEEGEETAEEEDADEDGDAATREEAEDAPAASDCGTVNAGAETPSK